MDNTDSGCLHLQHSDDRRMVTESSSNGMSVIKVGDIAMVRSGYPFRTRLEADPQGNAFVLQMKDVSPNAAADIAGAILTLVKAPAAHRLRVGDVVLKGRGSTHCAVVEEVPASLPLVAAAPIFVLRADRQKVEPAFLRWLLNHPSTQARLSATAVGTYVPTVTKALIEALEVDVPPLETQRLIVEVATLADRERELLNKISQMRTDATNQLLLRLCRTSGGTRKQGGRRGAATPRLADHKQR